MALMSGFTILFASTFATLAVGSSLHGRSLLQSWNSILDSDSGKGRDTPVTRVVNLLKEMGKTVAAEMEEDEGLFHKLQCWCNDNKWTKDNAVEASEATIEDLKSSIESLTGSTAELRANIKELEAGFTADKNALGEATALREKQLDEFHNAEKDSIQNIENLKAALTVLGKHHEAPPESTVAGGAIFKSERDSWDSFVQTSSKGFPSQSERTFFNFMRDSGFDDTQPTSEPQVAAKPRFLQQHGASTMAADTQWSVEDSDVVRLAVKSASAFVQSRHAGTYYPAYNSQSGQIMGVLKQLKEEMEGDLSESQKRENDRAAAFEELRTAKVQQIEEAERMAEEKEDQLANQDNELAEAKEDLGREEATLSADQKFLANLKKECTDAETNFNERKSARLTEMKAISETITVLQGDEARDAMSGTFNFMQLARTSSRGSAQYRQSAAKALRLAAKKHNDPQLSVLATSVELDAFTKVKKAIDDMIAMLKQQQVDEVKKQDWCKSELQSNEMSTAKGQTKQEDLEAAIAKLESDIKALEVGIADAKSEIAKTQVNLQDANIARKAENLDYQKNVADQMTTVEVLKKALDRLAKYYDLVQTQDKRGKSWIQRQTPDVVQMEYSKSKGATGVMEMIEKLIYDTQELTSESKKSETASQAAYEQLIADSNSAIAALQKEIVSKTQAKLDAEKDKRSTNEDLRETIKELEGLAKYNAELHTECDYVLKNFDLRQNGRAEEIEALQQAKQILNGASLS